MINRNLTEEEKREQIKGAGCDSLTGLDFTNINMFVEAGAGAGKTTLIVNRIVKQLEKDAPGSFVVITFTNAAAEELRGRIAEAVKKAGLTDALAHLDEMNISTIHSFCNVLLKEQAILAGLPQSMELMEEAENRELQLKFLHEFMAAFNSTDWDAMEKDAKEDESRWSIKQDLQDLYLQIVDLPSDTLYITPRNTRSAGQVLANYQSKLKEVYDELYQTAKSLLNPEAKEGKKITYTSMTDFLTDEKLPAAKSKEFLEAYEQQDYDTALMVLLTSRGNFFSGSGLTVAYLKDNVKDKNAAMNAFVDSRFGVLKELVPGTIEAGYTFVSQLEATSKKEDHYQILLEYAKKAKDYYLTNRPKNKLSNDNLLEYTRDLICDETDTRALEFFSGKYKHFYVDEFQDTDRIQEAFIYRLASDLSDPDHIKLRNGALFVVGDPKQSIYRFRGAQPKVYFDVKERMMDASMKNTQVYELANNFRSNSEIIDWVNEKFTDTDKIVPITDGYDYQSMKPVKKTYAGPGNTSKLLHGIYKYRRSDATRMGKVVTKDRKTGEDKLTDGLIYNTCKTEDDIQAVIDLILNLVNDGYQITRYDQENAPYMDGVHFKDFLLISQDKKMMEQYLNAFKAHGIAVRFDGEAELTEDTVLNTFCRLYWYLTNPKEPFHRMAAKEAIRVSRLVADENDFEEYADSLLDYLYDGAGGLSAFGKAVYLENQMAALLKKDVPYSKVDLLSVKTRLRQMIESVLNGATGTGVQLAEAFDAYLKDGVEHELSLDPGADAVRFMNVHKSKGLEGEIVILLDRRGHRKMGVSSMKDGASFYPGIKKWSSISGLQIYTDKNDKEEASEFHRLEYVAVTRAKQAFIFMDVVEHGGLFATYRKDKKGINYEIDTLDASVEPLITAKTNVMTPPAAPKQYNLVQDGFSTACVAAVPEKPLYVTVNPSGLEKKHSAVKGRVIRKNRQVLQARVLDKETGRTAYDEEKEIFRRPSGNILGNILHRTMELLIDRFDDTIQPVEIKKLTDFCSLQAYRENKEDIPEEENAEEYLLYVQKTAKAFYQWLLETRLLDGMEEAYTELPFSYYTEGADVEDETDDAQEKEKKNEWMHGTADLIIKYRDGRVCLIDYKSDNDFLVDEDAMGEGFREKYLPQVQVYRKIIKRMYGTADHQITAGIISFSLKDENGKRLDDDTMRVRYTSLD